MIPGNMMSWRQFEHLIPLLEPDFHVIAVSTDGFDGTGETTFTTAEASAEKLEQYIRKHLNGHVDLIFGESFGCATAGTLFHRQKVRADALILNGPQYMDLGIFNGFVTKVIPHNQYRLYSKIQNRKKLPLLLKLYTRSDDEALLRQFACTPRNAKKVADGFNAGRTEEAIRYLKNILELRDLFIQYRVNPSLTVCLNEMGIDGIFHPDYHCGVLAEHREVLIAKLREIGEV